MISVVIPARNREPTLGYCLKSVLLQTYSNFEVIVVDDGSTDKTRKVAEKFGDLRVRVISHDVSRGAQSARNTGIKAAQGEWIAFQDSDDEWMPEKLERQVDVLNAMGWNDRIVIHADMYRFYPATNQKDLWVLPNVADVSSYRSVLMEPGPVFQTMMVSKSALFEIGLLDERVPSYQEWDTSIRLAKICEFVQIREPLAVYWLHEGETISKNKRRDIDGYHYVIEKHRDEICRVAGDRYWHRHMSRLARRCSKFGFIDDAKIIIGQLPIINYWRWRAVISLYVAEFREKKNRD